MESVPQNCDAAADYLHNYPDFKFDMLNGMFLGEHEGKYYFYNKGAIGVLEGEYSVANNVGNYFSGAIVKTNRALRFIPAKMILTAIEKVGDEETAPSFTLPKDFPFPAEALCLETMRRIEGTLEAKTGINGWNHFVIILDKFISELGNKSIYFEGIDCYCFLSTDDVLMHYNPETNHFDWKFAEKVHGFKIRKQTLITLINRQRFA